MSPIPFYSINGSPVEERGIDDTNSDDCDFFLTGANNTADSNSVANTTSAQRAGEVDAEATTEADSGRPGRDRSAAERRLGRAGDRAGAWPLAQRDQYGDRARSGTGWQLRRRLGAGRSGSAVRPVGTPGQAGTG